ncbi:YfiR family protein [Massilia endophytica]|uniref:YfiR family protein n=1 Tax=Massilia endophytica TaxID=2899220 RepID=UPI001E3D0BFC|nr:YfiR family protein [Massilia endophytica]UGQ45791.1 YfiR family protein [Massilia endophytica]
MLVLAIVPALAPAQSGGLERQVKAAYLYKFSGFIEWPEGSFARPDSPLVIGIAGDDALAEQLERTVAGRSINGRPVQVQRLKKGEPRAPLHILFLGADRAVAQDMLAQYKGQPVLTVSDREEVFGMGSVINFVVAEERLRFEVSLKAAASAGLRVSARMLAVAYRVQQEGA